MFVIMVDNQFYTGRAGEGWLSPDPKQAFLYDSETGARYRATVLANGFTGKDVTIVPTGKKNRA